MNLCWRCELLNFVPVLSLNALSLDSHKVQNHSLQCAQKMTFSQDISSHRLFAILLNVRTLNGSSSFCSLRASGLFHAELLQLFPLFTRLYKILKEFPSQNHGRKSPGAAAGRTALLPCAKLRQSQTLRNPHLSLHGDCKGRNIPATNKPRSAE